MLSFKPALALLAAWALGSLSSVRAEQACPGDAGDGSWCYTVPDHWVANTSLTVQLDGQIPNTAIVIEIHKVSQWPNGSIDHQPIAIFEPFPSDPLVVTWVVNQSVGSSMHAHFIVGSDPKVTSATHVVEDINGNTGATTTYTVATGFATASGAASSGSASANADNNKKSGVSIGVVVGAVAAGIAIVLLIGGIYLYHRRAVKNARKDGRKSTGGGPYGPDYEAAAVPAGPKYTSSDGRPEMLSYDSYGSQYSGQGPQHPHMSNVQPYPTSLTHAALAVNASQHGSGGGHHTPEPSERFSDRAPPPPPPHAIQYQQPQPINPAAAAPVSDPRYSIASTPSANDHIAALTTSVTNSVLQQLASLHLASQRNTVNMGTLYEDGSSQGGGPGTGGANSAAPLIPSRPMSSGATDSSLQNSAPVAHGQSTMPSSPMTAAYEGATMAAANVPAVHDRDSKQSYNPNGMHVMNPTDTGSDVASLRRPEPSTSQPGLQPPTRAMSVTSMGTAPPLYRER